AFVADSGGRIVFRNALWLDTTGFSEGGIQNLEQIDRLETHFSHKLTPLFEKLFSFQHPEEMDISVVHKSGLKTTHFKLKASLFRKQYAFFSGIDVSEQVRLSDVLHDKKSQIFSLLNSLGDLVFKIDRNGDILNIWTSNLSDFFPGVNVIQRTNLSDYLPNDLLKS